MIEPMQEKTASEQIDDIIKKFEGWKGDVLTQLRALIKATDPSVVEEVKWKMRTRPEGLPVWSHDGMLCFAEIWKDNVKLIFTKGSQLEDPNKLFNARLKSSAVRAIEIREGDAINEVALKQLVIEAVSLNAAR
jgi:hypothetical protein